MVNDKKRRNSSFESLRMLLIFMVMLGHANKWYLGDYYQSETEHWIRIAVEAVCLQLLMHLYLYRDGLVSLVTTSEYIR